MSILTAAAPGVVMVTVMVSTPIASGKPDLETKSNWTNQVLLCSFLSLSWKIYLKLVKTLVNYVCHHVTSHKYRWCKFPLCPSLPVIHIAQCESFHIEYLFLLYCTVVPTKLYQNYPIKAHIKYLNDLKTMWKPWCCSDFLKTFFFTPIKGGTFIDKKKSINVWRRKTVWGKSHLERYPWSMAPVYWGRWGWDLG